MEQGFISKDPSTLFNYALEVQLMNRTMILNDMPTNNALNYQFEQGISVSMPWLASNPSAKTTVINSTCLTLYVSHLPTNVDELTVPYETCNAPPMVRNRRSNHKVLESIFPLAHQYQQNLQYYIYTAQTNSIQMQFEGSNVLQGTKKLLSGFTPLFNASGIESYALDSSVFILRIHTFGLGK
jgi:hypothetical protein